MKKFTLFSIVSFLLFSFFLSTPYVNHLGDVYAQEQEDWKQEYASICAKTQNAMGLSAEELKGYIERCDRLQERIDKLEGKQAATEKKVYTKRLKMCRDLYDFALEYKDNKE